MSIYKSEAHKERILALYDQKLKACQLQNHKTVFVDTSAGKTQVIITGEEGLPPLVLLHGINAGAPVSLEAMQSLFGKFKIYAVDSIGQATKSAETRLSVKDLSYGFWLGEVLDGLGFGESPIPVIGVSYGGFLLQKLLMAHPKKVSKAIFVVPGGVANSGFLESMKKLFLPMSLFFMTKKDEHLKRFISAFYTEVDDFAMAFQRETLLGMNMDYSRPPLLSPEKVAGFKGEVYVIVASDDVFFPGKEVARRIREAFVGFKEEFELKDCKHIPARHHFAEIAACLEKWLGATRQKELV